MDQVQCESWPDLQAPHSTSVLLDLHNQTELLLEDRPGTLLVHCSAGVGRTGAFLALYKLCRDFQDEASVEIYFQLVLFQDFSGERVGSLLHSVGDAETAEEDGAEASPLSLRHQMSG